MPELSSDMHIIGTGIACADPEFLPRFGITDTGIATDLLPPMLRRRTSQATRISIAAAARACEAANISPKDIPSVFVSIAGEIQITDKLCRNIAREEFPLSPTQFHNSVHNTAIGYWSIITGNTHPAQAMGAAEDSLAMGLLEAWAQLQNGAEHVLLVCYDENTPEPMWPDNRQASLATAFVLSRIKTPQTNITISRPQIGTAPIEIDIPVSGTPMAIALPLLIAAQNPDKAPERILVCLGTSEPGDTSAQFVAVSHS